MTADQKKHEGHRIVRDAFAELVGVARLVPGNLYCLDCREPVEATAADEGGAR